MNHYDLEPGDTVFIDVGDYAYSNVTVSFSDGGDASADVVFQGADTALTIMHAAADDLTALSIESKTDYLQFNNIYFYGFIIERMKFQIDSSIK